MTAVEEQELAVNRGQDTVAGALNGFFPMPPLDSWAGLA